MAITFPASPATNDQFVNGGRTWIWTGAYWQAYAQALSNATVNTAILAANSVTSEKIVDGTIVAGDIASNAVTTAKILDANVTAAKLANTAVTAGSYTASSITVDAQGRLTAASSGTAAVTPGLVPIIPTSVSVGSGSSTVSANGMVTFTGATSVSLDGIFSSTYQNYCMLWRCDPNASNGNLFCRMRLGGVTQSTTIYSFAAWRMVSDSTSQSDQCGTSSSYFLIGDMNSSADGAGTIEIFSPFLLKRTAMTSLYTSGRTDNKSYIVMASAQVNNLLSYDGFYLQPSGASNGTVAVYGYTI